MALYHLTVKIVGRSKGMDATAAAAYITRSKVYDRTTGETFDHTHHKDKAIWTGRFLPKEHPAWAEVGKDRKDNPDYGELWNLVEENEKRKDSQFARNFNIAAQDEFTDEENLECFGEFVSRFFTSRGIIADGAMHTSHIDEDGTSNKNKHFHLLACIRQVNKNGWESKKDRVANDKNFLEEMRKAWAEINNAMFDRKFRSAHKDEFNQIEEELLYIISDEDEREKEATEQLYDRYPGEWKHISEKTLDEQREELDMLLDAEEEKENPNWARIRRLEEYFLAIPIDAQRHNGNSKKKNKSQMKEKERSEKSKNLEADLSAVEVSECEITESLENDEEYNKLMKLKKHIILEMEVITESTEEVQNIKKQLDEIKTIEQMNKWKEEIWIPIKNEINEFAENSIIYDDVKQKASEICEVFSKAEKSEFTAEKWETIENRQKSLAEFIEADSEYEYVPTQKQKEEMSGTMKDISFFSRISSKFAGIWNKIKNKAAELIEKSPLRKFRVFREQQKLVDSWSPTPQEEKKEPEILSMPESDESTFLAKDAEKKQNSVQKANEKQKWSGLFGSMGIEQLQKWLSEHFDEEQKKIRSEEEVLFLQTNWAKMKEIFWKYTSGMNIDLRCILRDSIDNLNPDVGLPKIKKKEVAAAETLEIFGNALASVELEAADKIKEFLADVNKAVENSARWKGFMEAVKDASKILISSSEKENARIPKKKKDQHHEPRGH